MTGIPECPQRRQEIIEDVTLGVQRVLKRQRRRGYIKVRALQGMLWLAAIGCWYLVYQRGGFLMFFPACVFTFNAIWATWQPKRHLWATIGNDADLFR